MLVSSNLKALPVFCRLFGKQTRIFRNTVYSRYLGPLGCFLCSLALLLVGVRLFTQSIKSIKTLALDFRAKG